MKQIKIKYQMHLDDSLYDNEELKSQLVIEIRNLLKI